MKNRVILLFILFISLTGYSQKKFSAEILTGIGLNKNLSLINQNIEDYKVFTTQIHVNYQFKLYKTLFAETGIGSQWYFSSGHVALSDFKATSLRLNVPFIINYPILEKISIGTGIAVTNNRDFDDFDFRKSNNLRTSVILKGNYLLKENFSLVLLIKQNTSNIPDSYLVNQPNTDVSLGISYKLF